MNELIPLNHAMPPIGKPSHEPSVNTFSSKEILMLGGMLCITAVTVVGLVCFSGSGMSITSAGLTITHANAT